MPVLTWGNTHIYYERHGQGPPMLCLHGWNGSMASFKIHLVPRLQACRELILLDLPGCGGSEYLAPTFANITALIGALLDECDINKIAVAGFCMGGAYGLDFALRYPARVGQLFLLDTTLDFPWVLRPVLVPCLGRQILKFFLKNRIGQALSASFLLRSDRQYRKDFFQTFAETDVDISRAYIKLMYQYSKVNHYHRAEKYLRVKLVVITGEGADHAVRNSTRKLTSSYRETCHSILPGTSHFLIEENPAALARLLTPPAPGKEG